MSSEAFDIALIQYAVEASSSQRMETMAAALAQAAEAGAVLAVLPGLSERHWDDEQVGASILGPWVQQLGELAKLHQMAIATSLIERFETNDYCTAILIDASGRVVDRYRQAVADESANGLMPEAVSVGGERAHRWRSLDIGGADQSGSNTQDGFRGQFRGEFRGRLGVMLWQGPIEALTSVAPLPNEVDQRVVIYPTMAAWSLAAAAQGDQADQLAEQFETWRSQLTAWSEQQGVWLMATNRMGREDQWLFWGSSLAVNPSGECVFQAPMDQPVVEIIRCGDAS